MTDEASRARPQRCITIDQDVDDELRAAAKTLRTSVSALIGAAVDRHLPRIRKHVRDATTGPSDDMEDDAQAA